MKKFQFVTTAAAGGLCALLAATPAMAQSDSDHVDASGMPTNHSTPAEQAATANLNNNVSSANTAADANAAAANAQYQQQQADYQNKLATNQAAQDQYAADSAAYESLRARYAADRAAYHRHVWPDHYVEWTPTYHGRLLGARVDLYNGISVGQVDAIARNSGRGLEAVRVKLDDTGKSVWIDAADIRFNPDNQVVATNLDRNDLFLMADERL